MEESVGCTMLQPSKLLVSWKSSLFFLLCKKAPWSWTCHTTSNTHHFLSTDSSLQLHS